LHHAAEDWISDDVAAEKSSASMIPTRRIFRWSQRAARGVNINDKHIEVISRQMMRLPGSAPAIASSEVIPNRTHPGRILRPAV
jgi:hypothetical protein